MNRYTYCVPFTEEQLFDCYVNQGMTQAEIAQRFGSTQKVVWRAMRKIGIPARIARKRNQLGEMNSQWRGGRVLVGVRTPDGHRFFAGRDSARGYWMVKRRGHPHANKDGYVFEHIAVALHAANRSRLDDDECVHHINFNRHDNRPENLHICTTDRHRWYHANLETVVAQLLADGGVKFDPVRGYVVV